MPNTVDYNIDSAVCGCGWIYNNWERNSDMTFAINSVNLRVTIYYPSARQIGECETECENVFTKTDTPLKYR